jgi:DNA primase
VTAPGMSTGHLSPLGATLERHRLADVAERTGIFVAKSQGTLSVRCPMASHGHPDCTPSMRLFLDNDRYYCFGCGARGDVVQWARDAEGLSMAGAIAALDSRRPLRNAWVGQMPELQTRREALGGNEPSDPDRSDVGRLLGALAAAWGFYSSNGRHHLGRGYLAGRGVDIDVLEAVTGRAEVGHTAEGRDVLARVLRAQGFTPDELVDAGLAHRREGGTELVDVYRERALFPVRREAGHVRGLLGRNIGDPRWPKYLNPARSAVYDKSLHLYQPLPAPVHPGGHVVVVEGAVDALAVAAAAILSGAGAYLCPVTQAGRELSAHQVAAVLALHPGRPVIALDGDAAGREGAQRMERAFMAAGRPPLRLDLPEGEDPASWLASRGTVGLMDVIRARPSQVEGPLSATAFAPPAAWGASL